MSMSRPQSHASTTYPNAASSPSPSSSEVDMTQHSQPLPRTRRRAPSELDSHASPMTTATNSPHRFTLKRAETARETPAPPNAPVPSKAASMFDGIDTIKKASFHSHQGSSSSSKKASRKKRVSVDTSYETDSNDDEGEDEVVVSSRSSRRSLQQMRPNQWTTMPGPKSMYSGDYMNRSDDLSIKPRPPHKMPGDTGLDWHLDLAERFHHQSQSRGMKDLLKHGIRGSSADHNHHHSMPATSRSTDALTGAAGGFSTAGDRVANTHSSQANGESSKRQHHQPHHHHHPSTSSVASSISSITHSLKQQKKLYRQSLELERGRKEDGEWGWERYREQRRSSSSAGFFIHKLLNNNSNNSPASTPSPTPSRASLLGPHRAKSATNKNEPRVPLGAGSGPSSCGSSGSSGSSGTSDARTAPIVPAASDASASASAGASANASASAANARSLNCRHNSKSRPGSTNYPNNSAFDPTITTTTTTTPTITPSAAPQAAATATTTQHTTHSAANTEPSSPPKSATATPRPATIIITSPSSSSNVIIQEASTHTPFASSLFDFLNRKSSVSHFASASASALASGSGSGFGAAGQDPGPFPQRAHSRANSNNKPSSLRNLNRWSSSTTSSRLSAADCQRFAQEEAGQQKLSSKLARRMSLDSIGLWSQLQADSAQDTLTTYRFLPRKLSKRRSFRNSSNSPNHSRASTPGSDHLSPTLPPATSPPLPALGAPPTNPPPTISLPPLETAFDRDFLDLPRAMSRASPALNTPNSVFANQRGNGEPQDYLWNDLYNPSRSATPVMRSNAALLPPAPVMRDRDALPESGAHPKSRPAANGAGDPYRNKERSNKPSQKAMLSKALNKANTAVRLDNAQNYAAAKDAYEEACILLQQVMARTHGEDDRKKLDAIRRTYSSRIEELDELGAVDPHEDKALPARPDSVDYHGASIDVGGIDNHSDSATIRRNQSPNPYDPSSGMRHPPEVTVYSDFSRNADLSHGARQNMYSRSTMRGDPDEPSLTVPRSDDVLLPAPLSPRRPLSPARVPSPQPVVRQDFSLATERERLAVTPDYRSHRRIPSHESSSWLDPIDESGGSETSSVHSRSSSRIIRKHIRLPSGDTEAEFDAALDAAVEAAYDDGYDDSLDPSYEEYEEDAMDTSMRRLDLAAERARHTDRETAIEAARDYERRRQQSQSQMSQNYIGDFLDDTEDEEDERMLEEITKGYVIEDFTLDRSRNQTRVPRESDSSDITSRTWHSSQGSNPPTGANTVSAVSESASSGSLRKASSPPPMPPPTQSLPQLPNRPSSKASARSRGFSGPKHLKIETSDLGPSTLSPPSNAASAITHSLSAGGYDQQKATLSAMSSLSAPVSMRISSISPNRGINLPDGTDPASPRSGQDDEMQTNSPTSIRPTMRKIFSSSSLKSSKSRQLSISHAEEIEPPPLTPLTLQVSNSSTTRLPMMAQVPTPTGTTFDKIPGGFSGLHLFESDFHSPTLEFSHSAQHEQQELPVPLPLEPCPADPMLRPFWLMRALYQTLAHPRGGYISNRLFVPQDAWKVKGVKLKNVEDKISQCDLLTAALLKLARVDSNDADAVLDEMQSFENMLESIQSTLSRKLGTDVGTQGMVIFKDDKESEVPLVPRNNSMGGKSGAFSWRRLRNKGSAVNLTGVHGMKNGGSTSGVVGIPEREPVMPTSTMPSLPMVAHPSSRPAKRDVASVKFEGPNANYRASLARLFDAAQTVDQIARQVDDPGLRHADKTQVGLELCTRHAAEFFGFFICRFVLTDLGLLLDKFVKRGSEWVLS